MTSRELADMCESSGGCNSAALAMIAQALRAQADEIEIMQHMAVVQAGQVRNLLIEIDRLKAEMSVRETPDGGVAGMLMITPEAAKGLMEE